MLLSGGDKSDGAAPRVRHTSKSKTKKNKIQQRSSRLDGDNSLWGIKTRNIQLLMIIMYPAVWFRMNDIDWQHK